VGNIACLKKTPKRQKIIIAIIRATQYRNMYIVTLKILNGEDGVKKVFCLFGFWCDRSLNSGLYTCKASLLL
jgi:hypothetical protein